MTAGAGVNNSTGQLDMHVQTAGKINKPRNKVRRACNNCRKRKIKCTGLHPCASCEAYGCPCIFSPRGKGGNIVEMAASNNTNNCSSSSSNSSSSSGSGANGHPEVLPTPCSDSAVSHTSDHVESLPNITATNDYSTNKNGVYEDNSELETELLELEAALKQLESIRNPSDNILTAIESIQAQIDEVSLNWQPKINGDLFKQINQNASVPSEQHASIESLMLKNKYTDVVALTKYAIWSNNNPPANTNCTTSTTASGKNKTQYPLIDEFFGLYSAFEAFSFHGIGFCCKAFLNQDKSNVGITKDIKESLYITLRFFDMCFAHFKGNIVCIANPLESYLHGKRIPMPTTPSATTTPTTESPGSHTSGKINQNTNTKLMASVLIKMLPQPFVQSCTGKGNKDLLDIMYDDSAMFTVLLQMYESLKRATELFMMDVTDESVTVEITNGHVHKLLNLLDTEQLLMALTYSYYNSTINHYFNPETSLQYMDLLLSLMANQRWAHDKFGFGKVLSVAVQRAVMMGLSRWEYYVGIDESLAEKKRSKWWQLYCYEKDKCINSGLPSSINDALMTCMLPKCFRKVGFVDNKDFLNRVCTLTDRTCFDKLSLSDLIFYGDCALAQIYSGFERKVLFREEFTSIRNAALPPAIKKRRFAHVVSQFNETNRKFEAVQHHLSKLFEVARDPKKFQNFLSRDDIVRSLKFCLQYEYFLSIFLSTASNISSRFSTFTYDTQDVSDLVKKNLPAIHASWRRMTNTLLSFGDAYSMSKGFFRYCAVSVVVTSNIGCLMETLTAEDVTIILKVFKKMSKYSILTNNEQFNQVSESSLFKEYTRHMSFIAMMSRIFILKYTKRFNMTVEEFTGQLQVKEPQLIACTRDILDTKSQVYKYLLTPVQQSGFHISVRKLLKDLGVVGQQCEENEKGTPMAKMMDGCGMKNEGSVLSRSNSVFSTLRRNSPERVPHMGQSVNHPFTPNSNSASNVSVTSRNPNMGPPPDFMDLNGPDMEFPAYNLGTLDEFVKNSDLNDLYEALWSNLYPDQP
ncbi:drug-responsive transcription factor PDR1 KNAG_0D03520 [Huiozyma naganishii CBS 8797]|uniref:Zn(2)-C6 fungal-type domain-containing protein n=1 Tax=Huiozyma naganishii (strain ATCC MYA-139 / BCRC 22969 / CBS 8797 / KCTC 17520 / NBRC 10181 / NCYC 3082 / Yp74L-3) TaxID=1071383 RepID=J7RKR8_HUIN7|nr:hypothetical protein KNAG_0D03520 [Kazachstania naganishii CBS 8797]CCK70098.1 hypothetical protein KNAG_0D03520 [Kazachstania naganishii CBS 8797]